MAVGDGGQLGYNSFIGVGAETTWATKVTATTYLEFVSESLNKVQESEKISCINSSRNYTKHFLKNEVVSGSLECCFNPSSDGIALLLANAMGGSVTSSGTATTGYIHDIQQGNIASATNTSLTLTKRVGDTHLFDFVGCRVNSLSLVGEVGAPMMLNAEIVGKYGTTTTDSLTVALSDNAPLLWSGITYENAATAGALDASGVAETITKFELTINNNIISDDSVRSLGDTKVDLLPPGRADIDLKITQRFDTTTAYDRSFDHTAMAYRIVCTSDQTIGAGGGATTNSFSFTLPKGYYTTQTPQVGGPEVVFQEYSIEALAPSSGADAISMKLCNGSASY